MNPVIARVDVKINRDQRDERNRVNSSLLGNASHQVFRGRKNHAGGETSLPPAENVPSEGKRPHCTGIGRIG